MLSLTQLLGARTGTVRLAPVAVSRRESYMVPLSTQAMLGEIRIYDLHADRLRLNDVAFGSYSGAARFGQY
jgi:hypothetical protein